MSLLRRHRRMRHFLEAAKRDGTPDRFWTDLQEGFDKKQLKPQEFSLALLFEEFVPDGHEIIRSWDPRNQARSRAGGGVQLYESGGAVTTSDFSEIIGQITYSAVLEAYDDPLFIGDQLVTTVPTRFNGEKIPGVGRLGDVAEAIGENQQYPMAGVGQDWIETPETTKRGFIVPVTKEAIFFDRTGLVLQRAQEVGFWLGLNKEKRILDVVLGIKNNYKRKGVSIDTYGDDAGDHDWDNLVASNALSDWTNIENSELAFDGITDPNTGEPILLMPNVMIVPSALRHTARRIVRATSIQHVDNQANAATIRTESANPLSDYTILSNQFVASRSGSNTTWWHGDPQRSFNYMENWPITVLSAPPNSEMEFTHDIVHREKVTERGVCAVVEPRRMVKNTA